MATIYNQRVLDLADGVIEQIINSMSSNFTTADFCAKFSSEHLEIYEAILILYLQRGNDRPHAIQIANSQLMHTVRNKFGHLVTKTGDCPNPKGGIMSEWVRHA